MREEYDFNQGIKNPYTKEWIHCNDPKESGWASTEKKQCEARVIVYYEHRLFLQFVSAVIGGMRMDENPTRTYENDDIIVYWYADRCRKAKQCLMGSWQAFDLSRRPWVDVNAIPAKELAEIIDRCPTKALQYELKG